MTKRQIPSAFPKKYKKIYSANSSYKLTLDIFVSYCIFIKMKNEINILIDQIENHSNKKLNFRNYILLLIKNSKFFKLSDDFEKLIFLGKFIFNVQKILNRGALPKENYDNLLIEYEKNFETLKNILQKISVYFNINDRIEFENQFLKKKNSEDLYLLIEDFNEVKNYEIDKRIKII